jgi:uncharacterized Zn finger protein
MGYYSWAPYVSVAERRMKAVKAATKARKSGATLAPIAPYRGAVAKTFWGKAWCDNLEAYSDYSNRMPRGRTYVRNGSVIDLAISEGSVSALVMGSSLYKVAVKVQPVQVPQWQAIGKDCSGSIDSLVELLQGKLSTAVMQRICTPRTGLFPAPKEISFSCSCPDSASMCKHIAAVLYGVGARLDQKPELLFSLRKVNAKDLVSQAGAGLPTSKRGPSSGKVLDDFNLSDVFGIEMDEPVVPPRKSTSGKQMVPAKKIAAKPQKKVVTTVSSKSIKATAGSKVAKSSAHEGSKRSTTKTVAKKAVAKPQPSVQLEVKKKSARVTPTRPPKTVRPSAKKSSRQP